MDSNEKTIPGGVEQAEPENTENTLDPGSTPPAPEMTEEEVAEPAGGETIPDKDDNVVDFNSIPQKQEVEQSGQDTPVPEAPEKTAEDKTPAKRRGGRPPKADKTEKAPEAAQTEKPKKAPRQPKVPKQEKAAGKGKSAAEPVKEETPPAPEPEQPPQPREAPRRNGGTEQIVYLTLSELQPFKNHPFGVRDDSEMKSLVESVKDGGVNQPALVRPIEGGGYEIVAGHRRQKASELAGFTDMPCIVREMTDDEAIIAMTDDNLRQRESILHSEKAVSLKMQLDAISHQGARFNGVASGDVGKRSVDIVAERNGISAKQVQRYISLTKLVPDLQKMLDDKQLGFTQAVEFSVIRPKNQNLITVSIEGEQAKPSLSQAQRLRELDQKGALNSDVIDGILSEEKKEVDKVIITGAELNKYFGKEKTPREMKDQIIKLLDDWAEKEKTVAPPEKNAER